MMQFFELLQRGRTSNPKWAHAVTLLVSTTLTAFLVWLCVPFFGNPPWWSAKIPLDAVTVLRGAIGFVVTFIFFSLLPGLVSVLAYLPPVFSNRALGFEEVSLVKSRTQLKLNELLEKESEPIKVVCVLGDSLFTQADAPFRRKMAHGQVNVVMPTDSATNPTLIEFQKAMDHFKMDHILSNLRTTRESLKGRKNEVHQHDHFCPWRIILFSDHCVVAPYFPDMLRRGVWDAPHYFFRRVAATESSYYSIFANIFETLSRPIRPDYSANPPATSHIPPVPGEASAEPVEAEGKQSKAK